MLNKLDRSLIELQLQPEELYQVLDQHIYQVSLLLIITLTLSFPLHLPVVLPLTFILPYILTLTFPLS